MKHRRPRQRVWCCAQCMMSGTAASRTAARMGLLHHFMSEEHTNLFELQFAADLRRKLRMGKRRVQ